MAGHGGRRAGAGRPTDAAREAKRTAGSRAQELVKHKTYAKLPEIWDKVLEMAAQGDRDMIKLAVDHGLGRPSVKAPETSGNDFTLVLKGWNPNKKASVAEESPEEEADE